MKTGVVTSIIADTVSFNLDLEGNLTKEGEGSSFPMDHAHAEEYVVGLSYPFVAVPCVGCYKPLWVPPPCEKHNWICDPCGDAEDKDAAMIHAASPMAVYSESIAKQQMMAIAELRKKREIKALQKLN